MIFRVEKVGGWCFDIKSWQARSIYEHNTTSHSNKAAAKVCQKSALNSRDTVAMVLPISAQTQILTMSADFCKSIPYDPFPPVVGGSIILLYSSRSLCRSL